MFAVFTYREKLNSCLITSPKTKANQMYTLYVAYVFYGVRWWVFSLQEIVRTMPSPREPENETNASRCSVFHHTSMDEDEHLDEFP